MKPIMYPIFLVGFFAFVKTAQYVLTVKALWALKYKKAAGELKERADLPGYLREMFKPVERRIEELGFEFSHCWLYDTIGAAPEPKKWYVVYFNPSNKCYCNIIAGPLPDPEDAVRVEFTSVFQDGFKLTTTNWVEHEGFGEIPNMRCVDPYADTLEEHWKRHLDELREPGSHGTSIAPGPVGHIASEVGSANSYVESLIEKGYLKDTEEGTYRASLTMAVYKARSMLAGRKKVARMRSRRRRLQAEHSAAGVEIPIEAEVEGFMLMRKVGKDLAFGAAGKIAAFLMSLLLFSLVFKFALSFMSLGILVVVLFIHELGHYLGMVVFRFRDRQILFLPFLGAATFGSERKAGALERVIVYLLGPGPGLVLGTCCILVSRTAEAEFWMQCGGMFLILNYLNLLPIVPLDGGRVLELVLFSRAWYLKSAFLVLSTALFLLGAVALTDPILTVVSVFLILGLRSQIRESRMLGQFRNMIRDEGLEMSDEVLVPAIFRMLRHESSSERLFSQKFRVAKYLYEHAPQERPGLGASALALFLYVLVILLPVFIVFTAGVVAAVRDL